MWSSWSPPMLDPLVCYGAGRATLLRVLQPLLEPLLALATSGPRRPNESHTTSVGSRNESDEPGAWTEPRQVRVLQAKQAAEMRSISGRIDRLHHDAVLQP